MAYEIRRLSLAEMDAVAVVHRTAFDERLPWLSGLHTPDEDRGYFRGPVFETCEVWGAVEDDRLAGFIAFREGWIDQLYILPGDQGRGVGRTLLGVAKAGNGALNLWAFQRNAGARAFYEANGFAVAEFTDGSGNEEGEPDVRYVWRAG